jgi:uncharacterized protein (DUF4415 family)
VPERGNVAEGTRLLNVKRRARENMAEPTKKLVSLRLSGKVLEAYKAKGKNWQSRIDEDLRRINKIK